MATALLFLFLKPAQSYLPLLRLASGEHVPCMECDQCGEKYYSDDVAEKLELIVDAAKKLMQEIAVIDYQQAA